MPEDVGQAPRGAMGGILSSGVRLPPNAKDRLSNPAQETTLRDLLKDIKTEQASLKSQQADFDGQRAKYKKDQLARERQLQSEIEAREQFFADRERKLFDRQKEVEEQL